MSISDSIPCVWMLGDRFLKNIYPVFLSIMQEASKNKPETVPPYMVEFFNVKPCFEVTTQIPAQMMMTRILNNLTEAVNADKALLPRYLIVVLDKDLLGDMDYDSLDSDLVSKMIPDLVRWLVCQVHLIVHRKRMDLLEKRPGAVSGSPTELIFVKMLRRIGQFHDKLKMVQICSLRAKFNDALNDAVVKID